MCDLKWFRRKSFLEGVLRRFSGLETDWSLSEITGNLKTSSAINEDLNRVCFVGRTDPLQLEPNQTLVGYWINGVIKIIFTTIFKALFIYLNAICFHAKTKIHTRDETHKFCKQDSKSEHLKTASKQ